MTDSPHPIDLHVGRRLKLRRSLKGMSQERLGELLGLTFQQVQKYERGTNRIGSSRLYEIASVLEAPVAWFFEGAEATRPPASSPRVAALSRGFGLAEDAPRFDVASAVHEASPVQTREALEMVRAFNRIADPLVRRRLFELAKALASMSYRGADGT